jgi:hypothetical protein
MASIIAKNSDGKIWKNSDGKILKAKTFSQEVIQNGLSFWGAADPNYLTLVDGLVSEAYDIRGTGSKMIQATVANRPLYTLNRLYFSSLNHSLSITSTVYSAFIVLAYSSGFIGIGNGGSANTYLGMGDFTGNSAVHRIGSNQQTLYRNLTKGSNIASSINTYYALSTLQALGVNNPVLGKQYTPVFGYIKEWGWYNRVLNEAEVIYNQNALMTKYGIT